VANDAVNLPPMLDEFQVCCPIGKGGLGWVHYCHRVSSRKKHPSISAYRFDSPFQSVKHVFHRQCAVSAIINRFEETEVLAYTENACFGFLAVKMTYRSSDIPTSHYNVNALNRMPSGYQILSTDDHKTQE
jgi:hypothetical protein